MLGTQWARLRPDQHQPIRHGAWYRVVRLTPLEAVLDINGKPLGVPRPALQIVTSAPTRWAVVARSAMTGGRLPTSWGPRYAVCPQCRTRSRLQPQAASMQCPKCKGYFDVGWDDP